MPCSRTRLRHSSTVGRLTPSFSAIATFCSPATAPKIIRQRRATCCGVPWADSHCSSCVRSAACKLIGKLVFGMLEIIATAVKSVKLFMIHYTRNFFAPLTQPNGSPTKDMGRDQLKRNQFGGTVGGPIIHDKTFFFAGFQGTRLRNVGNPSRSTIPTSSVSASQLTATGPCAGPPTSSTPDIDSFYCTGGPSSGPGTIDPVSL